jgi:hypothetical protein
MPSNKPIDTPSQADGLDKILDRFHNLHDRFSGDTNRDWVRHVKTEKLDAKNLISTLIQKAHEDGYKNGFIQGQFDKDMDTELTKSKKES